MICLPEHGTDSIEADVAIVGAGPVGASLALSLAEAGVSAAVIESGGLRSDPWTTALSIAAELRPPDHAPTESATNRRLGGASWTWGGRCVDFDPLDFEAGGVAEPLGWPISHAEATAEATAAAAFFGIGPPSFDEPFERLDPAGSLHSRLERWCPDPRLARAHARAMRQSPLARFHLGLTCTALELDDVRGTVRRLAVKDRGGRRRTVAARHYVVAGGGVETARLLLASLNAEGERFGWLGRGYMGHLQGSIADLTLMGPFEQALGYRRDEAGRYIRKRLMIRPEILRREGLLNIAFVPENPPLGDPRHRSGALSAAALALGTPALGRALLGGPVRGIILGRTVTRDNVASHLANVIRDAPGAAGFMAQFLPQRLAFPRAPGAFVHNRAHRYPMKYYAEHSPLRDSRVTLSDQLDELGMRRVRVDKRVAPGDFDSVLHGHDILAAELNRSDWARLELRGDRETLREQIAASASDGYHQLGLARMSARPQDGVVDAHGRVHGVANLHVAGTSVFPTSGQANPTYLAVCLGLRLAKRLAGSLNGAPAPH